MALKLVESPPLNSPFQNSSVTDTTPSPVLAKFSSVVQAVAISPDGRRIAVGLKDGSIQLWDLLIRDRWSTFTGHSNGVWSIAFSPDGKTIVSGGNDMAVRLWDIKSGQLKATFTGHQSYVVSVAISSDGKTIVSGSFDHTVRLWNVESGQLKTAFTGHREPIEVIALSRDGKTIVSGSHDKTVRLWDVELGQLKTIFTGHDAIVSSVAISNDGKTIVSGSHDKTVRLWDVELGQLKATFTGHDGMVPSVTFSLDDKTIVSGDGAGLINLWDVETRKLKSTFTGHEGFVWSIAFSPDGKTIASGSGDKTVRLWDFESGQPKHHPFTGHEQTVYSIALSSDGKTLVSGSADNTVRLWDFESGQLKATFTAHSDWVNSVALSRDGKTVVSGSADGKVYLWGVESGQPKSIFTEHKNGVWFVALSRDGRTLISGSGSKDEDRGEMCLCDTETKKKTIFTGFASENIESIALSDDGKTIVTGNNDGTVYLWDAELAQLKATFPGHSGKVNSIALSSDGKTIVSSGGGTVCLWDAELAQLKATFPGHGGKVNPIALSSDGKTIVSANGTIHLWDLSDLQYKRNLSIGNPKKNVYSVVFHPSGDYILSAGDNGIRVWHWKQFEVQRVPQAFKNDQPGDEDQLAIEKELRALADVLMMRSLEPPLAVAILGGWGSGKSFGMNLIKKHITAIRCRSLTAAQTWSEEANDPRLSPYVGHIYQIKFDAWTYAKSDLWASLMQTIFFELNRQLTLEKQLAKIGSMQQRQALEDKLEQLRSPSPVAEKPQDEVNSQLQEDVQPESQPAPDLPQKTIPSLKGLFPQKLSEVEIKQFEKILTAGELKLDTEISQEQQQDLELGRFWQFLHKTEKTEREALINLAKQIKTAELEFLLEEQDQDFWQVLNTLNDAERTVLMDKLVTSKLSSNEIQKWKKTGGKGNSLWEILGELKKEEQENLKATQIELESLKQKKAQIEKQLQSETAKIERKCDRENENLALVRVFLTRLQQELQDKSESSIFKELSADLGLEIPENLAELDRELSKDNADLEQLMEKHSEQIEPLVENVNKIKSLLEDKPRRKLIGLIEFTQKSKKMLLVFCLWLAVPFLVYTLFSLLPVVFPNLKLHEWAAQIFSSIKVGLIALVTIPGLNEALKILKKAIVWQAKINREFQAFQENVEAERQQLVAAQPKKDNAQIVALQKLQAQLSATQSEITKLEIRAEAQRHQAGLTVQYGSLLEFVNDRLEEDSYQKRLGLMHQIKRDLEDLSDRLTCDSKHANPDRLKSLQTHFPRGSARVVLYIDDLDRCPPSRVVEVLESVQLLLTTKLFIVIIAVDDRYINRALENTYQGILKRRGTPSGVDYLEKIIQIPYRMRAISEKTVLERYLRSQLDFTEEIREEIETEEQPALKEAQTSARGRQKLSSSELVEPHTIDPDDGNYRSDRDDRLNVQSDDVPAQPPESTQPVTSTKGDFIEIAKFTPEEFTIILDCCQYVDLTPRTTKRIINLCKILKLVWTPTPNDTRWGKEPVLEVKQTVIAFLALSGRYPNQIRCVLEELYNNFEDEQLEASCRTHAPDSPELFKVERQKGELLSDAQKRYPLRDSYMEREWHRFAKDVMQVPPKGNAKDNPNNGPENDRFILEQRTFNLLLSFCFIGDVGYDPDDIYPIPLTVQTNGKELSMQQAIESSPSTSSNRLDQRTD